MEITVKFDGASFARSFAGAEKQLRFAEAVALTRTARDVREEERDEMKRVFDRPTPYSLNAFEVIGATRDKLEARVAQKLAVGGGKPRDWFDPQVHGGARRAKAFENALAARLGLPIGSTFFMPGPAARLDRYGNISGGQLGQVLSDLGARRDAAMNATAGSRKRNKRARHVVIGGPDKRRWFIGTREGSRVQVVLTITRRAPRYAERFDFYGVADKGARRVFPMQFERAYDQYVRGRT